MANESFRVVVLRRRKILLIVVAMSFIILMVPVEGKVTFIRPFEYSNGLVFAYSEDQGSLFIPASNGQFPHGKFDNVTLLIIPDKSGKAIFDVFYGKLNTTTSEFIPQTNQEIEVNINQRSQIYNLQLSVTESVSYVLIKFPGLNITFSYTSTDDAILLKNSKSSLTQLLAQNIIVAGLIALFSALIGGVIARRAVKLIIPTSVYYFTSGVFISLVILAAATGQNIGIVIIDTILGVVSFFVSAKVFEGSGEKIYIDLFSFDGDQVSISPNEILIDSHNYVIFETFTDMLLRVMGIKYKLNLAPDSKAWGNPGEDKLYFADKFELNYPRFILNTKTISVYALFVIAVITWWISQMMSLIFASVFIILLIIYTNFVEFKILDRGSIDLQLVAAMTSDDIAATMKNINHTYAVSKRYVDLRKKYHNLEIQVEEKSFKNGSDMAKQVLDMFQELIINGEQNGRKLHSTNSDKGRSQAKSGKSEQKRRSGSKNQESLRRVRVDNPSNGGVAD